MKKIKLGIDIDEVLRAKWLQFDRFYAQEFGEDGIPEQPYVFNFFEGYKWSDTIEVVKELKDVDEMPENINPLDYQENEKGEAPADAFIFKRPEENKLTSKEVYNKFMFEDFVFEIHGSATMMYRGMDVDVNKFLKKYEKNIDITVLSIENKFTIPPTLFFLSKIVSRFNNYRFVEESIKKWDNIDVLITTDPEILKLGVPWGKKLIKLSRPYNVNYKKFTIEALQIADLIDNPKFEKIIKYKKE